VKDSVETWIKPLHRGDWAVCFLNRSKTAKPIDFNWANESVTDDLSGKTLDAKAVSYTIKNIWDKKAAGATTQALKAVVPGHDVLMVRLTQQRSK
jgi:alpha-galactosidase